MRSPDLGDEKMVGRGGRENWGWGSDMFSVFEGPMTHTA